MSTYKEALAEFIGFGLTQSARPDMDAVPVPPEDIGDLADDALMELFSQLTQWANYTAVVLARAEVREEEAEAALRFAEAKYMVAGGGAGDKVTVVRAQRDTDEDIADLAHTYRTTKAFRKMTAALAANIERSTFLVSRELSRRVGLAPAQGRGAWMGR